jgi:hypothetical protein
LGELTQFIFFAEKRIGRKGLPQLTFAARPTRIFQGYLSETEPVFYFCTEAQLNLSYFKQINFSFGSLHNLFRFCGTMNYEASSGRGRQRPKGKGI